MHRVPFEQSRLEQIERMTAKTLDLLVVGGGIVGAGVARDAAMRGLRVGLAEQHDMASGTSSRSSRLLHGGLRYLAQGHIRLVREASVEKRILHRIAPHLADPLPFVFPTYRHTQWPLWQLRAGVKLYDLLCGGRNLGPSTAMDRAAVVAHLPGINETNLTGAVRYFDGLTNDARLVLDTLCSAFRHGAMTCNYTQANAFVKTGQRWRATLNDRLTKRTYEVETRAVVNATGPWGEKLEQSHLRLRLTKGVHLVIDRSRLPVPDAVVITQGERILFAIPWGERVILGTTDTDYHGKIEEVRVKPEDIGYIFEVVNGCYPKAQLMPADVISSWAGLRPLIASKGDGPSDISRAHQIAMPRPGWFDVAGGKLTTYRLIGEQTVDRVLHHLKQKALPCRTAKELLIDAATDNDYSGVLPPEIRSEAVEHYCRHEWALHLDDVMLRRTSWHYYHADADKLAEQVADWMAELLGWDTSRRAAEWTRYRNVVA